MNNKKVLDASVYNKGIRLTSEEVPVSDIFEVIFFPPGIYEVGTIMLRSGQMVYISGGAVVYGRIEAQHASDIKILGRGILDGSRFPRIGRFDTVIPNVEPWGTILLYNCENVEISGIIIRDPNVYGITTVASRCVRIENVKLIGLWRYNSDGIDLLNSEEITIEKCFVRSFDDSIVIKGVANISPHGKYKIENRPCRKITVRGCVVWNDWGCALEIGAETYASEISDVSYADCDIIHTTHVALDIQNGDHAWVKNIKYENIRVELDDYIQKPVYQKSLSEKYTDDMNGKYCPLLFVYEVIKTVFSMTNERGNVRNVLLKNICTYGNKIPRSYIRGYDADHTVENVNISNLFLGSTQVTDASSGKITIGQYVQNVTFSACRKID